MIKFNYVPINMEATGKRIKELRLARNLTVEQLCEYFSTSPQAIYKWQAGKSLPSLDNMMVLCDIFQTRVEDIVVRDDGSVLLFLRHKLHLLNQQLIFLL